MKAIGRRAYSFQALSRVYHFHLHPLQAANCCPQSRLAVDKDEFKLLSHKLKNIDPPP